MTHVYPVIISKPGDWYLASVPDLQLLTQGRDIAEAIVMARDIIGLHELSEREDFNRAIPEPSTEEPPHEPGELVTWVDIDFEEYKRMNDNFTVRRSITLPGWLDSAARRANINVSGVIQTALKEYLGVDGPPKHATYPSMATRIIP